MNQIKAVVWGAALVLLALIGGTGWLLYERIESTVAPKDTATKDDIKRVELKTKQLDQEVNDVKSELKAYIEQNDKKVAALSERVGKSEKEIGDLQGEVSTLKSEMKQVKEKGEANAASIKDLQDQIAEKEKRIADLEKERDKTKQELQSLQKDIDEIKKALGLKSPN
ncbi:MAG: hypothetical protein IT461_04265 [Planctomycetes bacterium]|jgi:chromosome segregation ATPase|nr:hypothetical protein [Planctomycetota bacterium]